MKMNKVNKVIAMALAMVLCIFAVSCEEKAAPVGSVKGVASFAQLADSSGINVVLEDNRGSVVSQSITDADGAYEFMNVLPGDYRLSASSEWSLEKTRDVDVTVSKNAVATPKDIVLTPTGNVSGRITMDGKPFGNAGVIVYIAGTSYVAVTDDSGDFSIYGVPVGSEYVLHVLKNYVVWGTGIQVAINPFNTIKIDAIDIDSDNLSGASVVWQGSFASAPEKPRELWAYYNTVSRTSYIYSKGEWHSLFEDISQYYDSPTIKGRIGQSSYYSVQDTFIKVVDNTTNETVWNDKPRVDGSFEVSGLNLERTYTLYFSTERSSDVNIIHSKSLEADMTSSSYSAIRTTVSPLGDVGKNIGEVMLYPSGTVYGNASLNKSSSYENIDVFAENTSYATKTKSDGSYVLHDMPQGTYRIVFMKDGYILQEKSVVLYSASNTTSPVVRLDDLTLTRASATISGTASYSNKEDRSAISIVLLAEDGSIVKSVTTTSDGSYSFDGLVAGTYTVKATADGYEKFEKTVEAKEGEDYLVNPVLPSSYGSIKVTVSYFDRETAEDIIVSIYKDGVLVDEKTTGSNGVVIIVNLLIGNDYSVIAKTDKEGYNTSGATNVAVKSDVVSQVTLDALANRQGTVTGSIKDIADNPVSFATVLLASESDSYTITSDMSGSFRRDNILAGEYTVSISKEGFASKVLPQKYTVEGMRTTVIEPVTLSSNFATISGTVSYADNDMPSNISVTIEDANGIIVESVMSGTDGTYSFRVPTGSYLIRANAVGYGEESSTISVVAGRSYSRNLNALVSVYGTISGSVKDIEDNPVSFATVLLASESDSYTITSDMSGSFRRDNILAGEYTVSISKEGFASKVLPQKYTVEGMRTTVIEPVTLSSNFATISGTVSYADNDMPSNISVTIEDADGIIVESVMSGTDGTYSFRVPTGTYLIRANAVGYAEESSTISVMAGRSYSRNFNALVSVYGTISGSVKDQSSVFLEGVSIVVRDTEGRTVKTMVSGTDGRYMDDRVPVGNYTVTISKIGYIPLSFENVTVTSNGIYSLGERILSSGTTGISGRVILEGETNYSGITVSATLSSDTTVTLTTTTLDDGSYYLVGMENKEYFLKYQKAGYVSDSSQRVAPEVGSISQIGTITLKTVNSSVSGTVTLEGAAVHDGIAVLLESKADPSLRYSTTTNQSGSYAFSSVKPGEYTLTATKSGYDTFRIDSLFVESSVKKSVDASQMAIAFASVSGRVQMELKTDHAGALVTATNLSESTIIYSAITNSEGNYYLAGMNSGEYMIVITADGYVTATLPTVRFDEGNFVNVGTTDLSVARGTIAGLARLEGFTDHSGIAVTLLGTEYTTTTAEDGSYSFSVPSGNYPGGIRYEHEDYTTASHTDTIPVLTNSTYAIPDKELKAEAVALVSGQLSIKGILNRDYSGITVTIEELPGFSFTTEEDGAWFFEHVPVGYWTFNFERENIRKVTKKVTVAAAPSITVENLELIPDAATIEGNITMLGVSDYTGVNVTVKTADAVDLKTTTNAAGHFYLSNVLASKEHTVLFEKTGWDTASFTIAADELEPLSLVTITDAHPVEMVDTTAPVIRGISTTLGKSTLEGREISLYLATTEEGSGIRYIQTSTTGDFTGVDPKAYYNPYTALVPDTVGDWTIYVRVTDGAGNVSETSAKDFVISMDKNEMTGVLTSEADYHWTKDGSPYYVTGNVLVKEGKTLVIDPGVEVQFSGAYYMQVEGKLEVRGTEEERVKIYGVGNGIDKWRGIYCKKNNGSFISHADISNCLDGIQGYCDISNCLITAASSGAALGANSTGTSGGVATTLYGDVRDTSIIGKFRHMNGRLSNVDVSGAFFLSRDAEEVYGCTIDVAAGYIYSSTVLNTTIEGTNLTLDLSYVKNSDVKASKATVSNSVVNLSSFSGTVLSLSGGAVESCVLNDCTFTSYTCYALKDSNLIGCGNITITTSRDSRIIYDMTGNFWGDDKTIEIETKGEEANLSFISDYYDDFNKSRIDYSGYRTTMIPDIGYQGSDWGTTGIYSGYGIGDRGPAGGFVFYDKGYYSDGWRYLEAAPADLTGTYVFGYYRMTDNGSNMVVGSSRVIGSGKTNTEMLVAAMGVTAYSSFSGSAKTPNYAAKVCADYEVNGYDDWFLPSIAELNELYKALKCEGGDNHGYDCDKDHEATSTAETRTTFSSSKYWSSSEYSSGLAWYQNFSHGHQDVDRDLGNRVRPVRAF